MNKKDTIQQHLSMIRHGVILPFLFVLLLTGAISARAQNNYVPNGNFEKQTAIPEKRSMTSADDRLKISGTGWRTASSATTPDYFHYDNNHTCTTGGSVDVDSAVCTSGNTPRNNEFGEEKPSSGKAYAGIIIGINKADVPMRVTSSEYLFRPIGKLKAGDYYYVSFKISFAEGSFFAVNNIGAWVTDSTSGSGLPTTDTTIFTGRSPQLLETSTITKMNGWYTVKGIFQASSSMNCIVVGYFPKGNTIINSVSGNGVSGTYCYKAGYYDNWAYYFIDDVRIYKTSCDCSYDDSAVLTSNGDFSGPCASGPTGYSTDLHYYSCSTPVSPINPGVAETDSGKNWDLHWQVTDHTPGGGTNVLMVDGPVNSDGNKRAWYKNVSVVAGERYCFSAWVRNMCDSTYGGCYYLPSFELRVNGISGTLIAQTNQLRYIQGWQLLTGTYTATTSGSLELDIVIKAIGFDNSGNDGAIDDVMFIRLPSIPSPLFTYSQPKCHTLMTFTAAPGTDPYVHDWTFREGLINTPGQGINPTFNPYQGNQNPGKLTVIHKVTYECGIICDTQVIELPDCRPCCDTAIQTYLNPVDSASCCNDLMIQKSNCSIYGAIVDLPNTGGIALQSSPLTFPVKIGRYCVPATTTKNIKVRFLGKTGDTVCNQTINVSCDTAQQSCCRSIEIFMTQSTTLPPECACLYIIKGWQDISGTCKIYGFRILKEHENDFGIITPNVGLLTPLKLKQGVTLGTLCLPYLMAPSGGSSRSVQTGHIIVQLLDSSGNVRCSQTLTWTCDIGQGTHGGGSGGSGSGKTPQNGSGQATGIDTKTTTGHLALSCVPNPFTKESQITYSLPANTSMTLSIYNIEGQLIEQLDQGLKTAGQHNIACNNKLLAPGIYILNLTTEYGSETLKILVTAN